MRKLPGLILSAILGFIFLNTCNAQEPVKAVNELLLSLDAGQKAAMLFPFDTDERYNFHFVPRDNRKGIPMNELNDMQKQAALKLLRSCLSEQAVQKVEAVMQLEPVLKTIENRSADDHYRDPGKYYFSIFGIPADNTIWGWRLEGHHIAFNFSVQDKKLVSGTPGFLGSNPAIVKEGPAKGRQVLKEETDMGFDLLKTLGAGELEKAVINPLAPADILTFDKRKAMIENPLGIRYTEMNTAQQQSFLQLVSLYIHRYTKLFADDMLKEIQQAGLENLRFAWAGNRDPAASGKPYYYRIQGPTIIIEFDNSQNNANHIHSVVRDLKHDFGGDLLLEHYRSSH